MLIFKTNWEFYRFEGKFFNFCLIFRYSASRRPPVRQSNFGRPANQQRSWSNDNRSHPQAEFFRKTSPADPAQPRPAPGRQRFPPQAEVSANFTVPPISANGINGQHNLPLLTEGEHSGTVFFFFRSKGALIFFFE